MFGHRTLCDWPLIFFSSCFSAWPLLLVSLYLQLTVAFDFPGSLTDRWFCRPCVFDWSLLLMSCMSDWPLLLMYSISDWPFLLMSSISDWPWILTSLSFWLTVDFDVLYIGLTVDFDVIVSDWMLILNSPCLRPTVDYNVTVSVIDRLIVSQSNSSLNIKGRSET